MIHYILKIDEVVFGKQYKYLDNNIHGVSFDYDYSSYKGILVSEKIREMEEFQEITNVDNSINVLVFKNDTNFIL